MQFLGDSYYKPRYLYDNHISSRPSAADHPIPPGWHRAPAGGMPHQFGSHLAISPLGRPANPALMGGMPPGGIHDPQHLNPASQQLEQSLQQYEMQLQQYQQQKQPQQQHARQAVITQHSFKTNIQIESGKQFGMGSPSDQPNPQQLHQLRQSGRLNPAQHPQAQDLIAQLPPSQQEQQQAQQQQVQGNPFSLHHFTQIGYQKAAAAEEKMEKQQIQRKAQHARAQQQQQNVSYYAGTQIGTNESTYEGQTHLPRVEGSILSSRSPYASPFSTIESKSHISDPTGNNRSIHATISKDHTAGDDAQSAVSLANFGQKIQWRACPTFERRET